jgi:hypothetical protein
MERRAFLTGTGAVVLASPLAAESSQAPPLRPEGDRTATHTGRGSLPGSSGVGSASVRRGAMNRLGGAPGPARSGLDDSSARLDPWQGSVGGQQSGKASAYSPSSL